MPGYSGTPLPKKLGIKEGFRVCLVEAPADVRAQLQAELAKCEVPRRGPLDFAMVFTKSKGALTKEFARVAEQLASAGMLWVSWPKKTSGVATDVDENVVRAIGLAAGLGGVKGCAVAGIWSGVKFGGGVKDTG